MIDMFISLPMFTVDKHLLVMYEHKNEIIWDCL